MTDTIDELEEKRKERAEQLNNMAESLGFAKKEESKKSRESRDASMITNDNLKEATFNFLKGKLITQPNLPPAVIDMTLNGFSDADTKVQNYYSMMALNFLSDAKRESLTGKLWKSEVGHYYMNYYAFKTIHLVNNETFKNLNDNFFLPFSRQELDYKDQNILLPAGILISYSRFCNIQNPFDEGTEVNRQMAISSFKLVSEKISRVENDLIKALSGLVELSFNFLEDRENKDLRNSIIDSVTAIKSIYTDYLKKAGDDKQVIEDQMSEIDYIKDLMT